MTRSELESVMELHEKAYRFLWSCERTGRAASQAFDGSVVAVLRSPEDACGWIRRHYQELPLDYRPAIEQIDAFAQLLCSYFATSFALIEKGGGFRLQSTRCRRPDGGRKSKRSKAKEQLVAEELRRIALHKLAEDSEIEVGNETIQLTIEDPTLAEEVSLWAYANQLVQRSQFFSQGPAVHRLWLSLSEESRRHLSANLVWAARDRLVQHFQTLYSQHQQ